MNEIGYSAVRVSDVLSPSASDRLITEFALADDRTVLTQDLDFSAIMALSGQSKPSVITLRLTSSKIEHVNAILEKALPMIEQDVSNGSLVTIEDHGIRSRELPL